MATLLRKLRVKRIDLVDKGANFDPASGEGAHVLLYKREEDPADDGMTEFGRGEMELLEKAPLAGESRGNLDDKDFAAVWTDGEGRKQRKLPIHDAAHVRNALARFNQTDMPAEVKAKAKAKLEAAKRKFGIGEEDKAEKMQPTSSEVNVDEMARCKKCGSVAKQSAKVCPKCGAKMPMEGEPDEDDMSKAAASRPKEDTMADEKLKADLDAANAKIGELQKRIEAYENTPDQVEKRRMAELPESVRKRIEENETKIAKLESEKAESEMVAEVKKSMPSLPGKHEEAGALLKRAKDVLLKEDFEALTTILKAASAQIAKGGLFAEHGQGGDGAAAGESPKAQIERLVAEKITKSADQKLSHDEAVRQVCAEHPDLYVAYAKSVTADVNKRGSLDAN